MKAQMIKSIATLTICLFTFIQGYSQITYITNPVDPSSRQLSQTAAVGTSEWTADVGSKGESIYSIPVYVPPGTNEMAPSVSIKYNSKLGKGLVGYGWYLSGISKISLAPTNWFSDGTNKEVNLLPTFPTDFDQKLTLDGQELIITSLNPPVFGTNTILYETKTRNYAKITRVIEITGSGISSDVITVLTKKGTTKVYGATSNSKSGISWYITKETDANGNYIEYSYQKSGNEIVVSEIAYTGNTGAGLLPYNKLKFYYDTKTDHSVRYITDEKFESTKLLERIDIECEGTVLKKYGFEYVYDEYMHASKLYSVSEEDKNAKSYNNILVDWGEIATSATAPYTSLDPSLLTSLPKLIGDFDGDGMSDFVATKDMTNGIISPMVYISARGSVTQVNPGISYNKYYYGLSVADVDSDGDDELIVSDDDTVKVYHYNHNAFDTPVKIPVDRTGTYALDNWSPMIDTYMKVAVADFTGDGRNEIVYYDDWYIFMITDHTGAEMARPVNMASGNTYMEYKLLLSDFNGNGKKELILYNLNNVESVFEFNNISANFDQIFTNMPVSIIDSYYSNTSIADLNGDGKSDIFIDKYASADWKNHSGSELYISTGTGFSPINFSVINAPAPQPGGNGHKFTGKTEFIDYNNDGITDMLATIEVSHSYPQYTSFHKHLYLGCPISTDQNGNDQLVFDYGISPITWNKNKVYGDFNGDGMIDLADVDEITYAKADMSLFVEGVYDGLNNYVKFEYESLSNDLSYNIPTGISFPNNAFKGANFVVKKMTTPDGTGSERINEYFYETGIVNRQGLGFLGFNKVTTQKYDGISEIAHFANYFGVSGNYNHYHRQTTLIEKRLTSGGTQISDIESQYTYFFSQSGKQINPYINIQIEKDYFNDIKVMSVTSLNPSHGTITYNEIGHSNLAGGQTYMYERKDFTYTNITGVNYNSLVTNAAHMRMLLSPYSTTTREKSFTYDSKGNMLTKVIDPSQTQNLTETYGSYNLFGMAQSKIITASDIVTRTTNYTYDAKSRFIVSESNTLGTSFTNTYEPMYGKVLSSVNIDNLTTTNTYDNFGNLLTSTDIDGNVSNISRYWLSSGSNSLYEIHTYVPFQKNEKVSYDMLNREVAKKTYIGGVGSTTDVVYSFIEYNSNGKIYRESDPCINPNPALIIWTTNTYDAYGRLSNTSYHNHIDTDYTYASRKTTIENSDANIYQVKTYDAFGKIISSKDNGGEITFKYDTQGNVTETTTNGLTITKTYDHFGRKITENNPNTGLYSYQYNSLGELTRTTTAKNHNVNLSYDQYGRLTSEVCNGETKTYTYNDNPQSSGGLGLIKSITQTNGINISYSYNTEGRVSEINEVIEGMGFDYIFKYSSNGQLSEKELPNGYSLSYSYDINSGKLTNVVNDASGTHISSLQGYYHNAGIGTHTKVLLGDNLLKEYTFNYTHTDPGYNKLTEILYSDANTSDQLIKTLFEFEPYTGNLLSREDGLRGMFEKYGYDNLNRLNSIDGIHGQLNTDYAGNGNIISSTQIGSYTYDATRLNAVSQITSGTDQISEDIQVTEYTYFNKVKNIKQGPNVEERGEYIEANIKYGHDNERRFMEIIYRDGSVETIYYADDYELTTYSNGDTKENIFIYGVDGLDAVCNAINGKEPELYFVAQDQLGSIVALLDKDNKIVNEYSYDAWGRKRNPENWKYDMRYLNEMPLAEISRRGYTKHEHLDEFQLINMNGRVYDPVIRQMTSPDILEFDILTTQSYNRYAYSLNNPLKYIDPTGYMPDFPIWVGGYWKNTIIMPAFKNHQASYPVGALSALGVGISHTHYWLDVGGAKFHISDISDNTGSNGKIYAPYLKGVAQIPRIPITIAVPTIKSVWVPLKCLNPEVLPMWEKTTEFYRITGLLQADLYRMWELQNANKKLTYKIPEVIYSTDYLFDLSH